MQSKAGKRDPVGQGEGAGFYSMVRQAGLPKGGTWSKGPLEETGKCAGSQDATVPRRKGQWEVASRNVLRGRCCGELTSTCKNFGFYP